MRLPTGCPLLVLAALVLLAAMALAPAASAKGKKVTCKGGKVPVTVNKKTTCQQFAKLFPKPQAIDPLQAQVQEALKLDLTKAGGRKAKRLKTPRIGFGAAGRRAQKKLLKVLPKAFALIERSRKGAAGRSSIAPGPAFASACSAQRAVDDNVGNLGGVSVGVSGQNGGQIGVPIGGVTYRMRFTECGSKYLYVLGCPKSNGDAPTQVKGSYTIVEEVLEDGRVVSRTTIDVDRKVKGMGKVAKDAKLDYFDLEVVSETFIVATGGIVLRGTTVRSARVNMRNGGNYDPANASVRVTGDAQPKDDASTFARYVEEGIREYRAAESGGSFLHDDGWSEFERVRDPLCAKAVFSPESNTIKLKKGDKKQISIYAKGQDGGRASDAKWTLLDKQNADFDPSSSEGPTASISYTVTDAPKGGFVKVRVKFTSTAGVGEDTWMQPTEPAKAINTITGTFSEKSILHVMQGDSVAEWSGNVTFERFTPTILGGASGIYKFKSGFLSVTFSGNGAMTFSAPLCSQNGSSQLAFSEMGTTLSVLGTGPEQLEPYEYDFTMSSNNQPLPMVQIVLSGCGAGSEELEGETFDFPATFAMTNGGNSLDGITYGGIDEQIFSGSGTIEHWSFTGSE